MFHPKVGDPTFLSHDGKMLAATVADVDAGDETLCTLSAHLPNGNVVGVQGCRLHQATDKVPAHFEREATHAGQELGAAEVGVRGQGKEVGQGAPHGQQGKVAGEGRQEKAHGKER